MVFRCHTLRGCVDWNIEFRCILFALTSHTLRGCVDWNFPVRYGVQDRDMSHPSWVCGLKHNFIDCADRLQNVTPFVGVWIETWYQGWSWNTNRSHTLRGCVDWNVLKLLYPQHRFVTPFVGVWIETWHQGQVRGCNLCHTLRGCVDWNIVVEGFLHCILGHTLRGCVDWNHNFLKTMLTTYVTPFVGVWIETSTTALHIRDVTSHPSWVCGLKRKAAKRLLSCTSHTLRGCVDWNFI